jgi:hypothetical protein
VTQPADEIVARFIRDGRLVSVPAKRSRRLILLDHIAQRFEPGVRYPEGAVNRELRDLHDDYAALRRYLIDEGFMEREGGMYWRTGGTVTR